MASSAQAPRSQAYAPLWLKVLVIVMGLLIVAGFIVVAAEIAHRMSTSNVSTSNVSRPPAAGASFAQRIALPPGAHVVSMNAAGERLVVHVEAKDGLSTAYVIDPRTGALLGTIAFPPGAAP